MAAATPLPERLGKYPITSVIGQGAMGVVYKGFDPVIQRPVAIKTVHTALLGEDDPSAASMAARFRNEAQAVGRLVHPGIVAIYEYGEDTGRDGGSGGGKTAFIAMEYVEGRNLDQLLATTPRLPEAQVLRVMDQLLDALACAHRHGVWHRDIKPANLILTASGQIKLTDFGIARIEHQGLTQVNSMIGTPGYMAPEQYIGEGIDHRADLFACGVLLYRLLTGVAPFAGTPETVMYKVMNVEPTPPGAMPGVGFGRFYDAVIARAMAKQPEERFASAEAFRAALAARALPAGSAAGEAPTLDGATVVRPAARAINETGSSPISSAPTSPPPTSSTPVPTAAALPAPTGWDSATLTRVEQALASVVGPMARLMVRQAARKSSDLAGLTAEVAQQIDGERERALFVAKMAPPAGAATGGGASGVRAGTLLGHVVGTFKGAGAASADAGSGARASASAGSVAHGVAAATAPLTEEMKARAVTVLSRYLGPIARIVVKRAAAQAQDSEQFWQAVAEGADGVDARTLLAELRKAG